jgi:methylenetetrahydrofolate reductase (NADPH)
MKIRDALGLKAPCFSFEFFPPKDEAGTALLFDALKELHPYRPAYVSVTYGAGGSTRAATVDLVRRIKHEVGIEAMAHLTCVGSTREEIHAVLSQLRGVGVENVLVLRGDPPKGQSSFVATAGGFQHASELAAFVRQSGFDFCLAAACYPEGHTEAVSLDADLEHLKTKVDAGIDFLITQLFFDNSDYFRFVERARKAGISVPILAGLMPVTNVAQLKRFTQMCGAKIPGALLQRLEPHEEDRTQIRAIGVEHATRQAEELLAQGAPGLHFYTLNRSLATREILDNLRQSGRAR